MKNDEEREKQNTPLFTGGLFITLLNGWFQWESNL